MAGIVDVGIVQGGVLEKSVAGNSNVTLTAEEAQHRHLVLTGVLTGNIQVILGAPLSLAGMDWFISNETSGAYTVTVIGTSGAGVVVTQGKRAHLQCDGTDIVPVITDAAGSGFAAAGANADITSLSGLVPGSASATVRAGGVLKHDLTAVGNVGGGEDDLITYAVPAAALAATGQRLRFTAFGTYAANGNNKTLKAYFGATALLDTGAVAANAGSWCIRGEIIRTGATTQVAITELLSSNSSVADTAVYSTPAETLAGAVTLKCTGEGTANDDIVQRGLLVEWLPAGA